MNAAIDCLSISARSPDIDLIASAHSLFTGRYWTGYISLTSSEQGKEPITADLRAGVAAVSWLNNGSQAESPLLVSGSDDGSIDLWRCNLEKDRIEHVEGKAAHDHIISSVSAAVTGNTLATASWDLRVRVWSTLGFLENTSDFVGHTDLVHSVIWADSGSGGQVLFSASQDKTVRQWDVRSNTCVSVLRLPQPATVTDNCLGGTVLGVGDELGSLTFFDIRKDNVQLASLQKLHHDAVSAIAAPPEDSTTFVASSGDDGRICTVPKGPQISATKQQVRTPHKDGCYIRALCYGQKGLYSAGWDGKIECSSDF